MLFLRHIQGHECQATVDMWNVFLKPNKVHIKIFILAVKKEKSKKNYLNIFISFSPRFHGVMVSTQDSESCDPSSNLGGT